MPVVLINKDCILGMRALPDACIDAFITDPPYGMAYQSNRCKNGPRHKKIKNDNYLFFDWIPEAVRVLKPGGAVLTFCDWKTSCKHRAALETNGLSIKSQVIWDRVVHGMGDLKGAFAPCHDVIWYATKGRRIFTGKRPISVLRVPRPAPSQDNGHPTCKPVDLMRQLIRSVCSPGEIILDPFIGSGSTGVAAVNEGCGFIGFEIDTDYFVTAEKRINEAIYDII